MSQQPKFTAELHKLCGKLRENDITDAEAQRLSEMLMGSRGARQFYRTFMALASALETRTSLQDSVDQETDSDKNIEVLFDLLHMEQQAEVIELPLEPLAPKAKPRRSREESLGWREFADASTYLLKRAARSTPAKWLAAAAVIALGVLIAIQFMGPTATPNPDTITDNTQPKPAESAQPILRDIPGIPVATITATDNAAWAEGASAPGSLTPGSKLHPNQRLTLTAGFAEITTHDGAIAILEAPATFELLDNNNAIRLHTGKLVGICETESSKGFLVRTPHMVITDLGTRFGVDASEQDATEVHVFEGEVRVDRPATGSTASQRQTLTQGQAVRAGADATSDRLVSIPTAPDRFTLSLDKSLIAASGRGQVSGEIDPNWRVVAVDGQPVTENGEMTVWSDPKETVPREASKWLRVNNALNPPGKKRAVFTCRSTFELAEELDTAATELCLRLRADHTLAALRINGEDLDVPKNRVGIGPEWLTWTLTQHFVPGKNTIELDIEEIISLKKEGSSGLRAELELQTK